MVSNNKVQHKTNPKTEPKPKLTVFSFSANECLKLIYENQQQLNHLKLSLVRLVAREEAVTEPAVALGLDDPVDDVFWLRIFLARLFTV